MATKKKECAIAFVGQAVPDLPQYNVPGFARAGNLAQIGFLEALRYAGLPLDIAIASQPIAYFPRCRTVIKRAYSVEVIQGISVKLTPLVNLFIVRDVLRAFYIYGLLFFWSLRNIRKERVILTYNLSVPPILPILILARFTGAKLVSILYDIAWPEGFKYEFIRNFVYGTMKKMADRCIPRLNGRIVITDAIAYNYAPHGHFLRVDGGVTEQVECRLFPLVPAKENEELILLFAGGMDEWNHIPMLLEMMKRHPDGKLKLWLAGCGEYVDAVLAAAKTDARISYHGVLNHDQLFELYKKADVLLNLRNTKDPAMQYHFPSKLLEILTVGKPVITTSIAHVKEEYGPYCFVLFDETPEALMELMQKIMVLSPDERVAIGKRAREYMLREHTWKKQGLRIKEYLENKVLGKESF